MTRRLVVIAVAGALAVVLVVVLWADRAAPGRAVPAPEEEVPGPSGATDAVSAEAPAAGRPDVSRSRGVTPPDVRVDAPGGSLGPLRTLRGRVEWEDGAAVAGARVVLVSSPLPAHDRGALARARVQSTQVTDEAGAFEVPWAPGGLWSLRVEVDERIRASVTEPPAGDELVVVLARGGAALELETVDAATGEPVSPTVAQLQYAGGGAPQGWRATLFPKDRDGSLRWGPVASGRATLSLGFDGYEWVVGEPVDLRAGETTRKRIELHRGETVRGTVVDDETGAPVAGAVLVVGWPGRGDAPKARSDARGRFELRRVPWDPRTRRTLHVRAEGYAVAQRQVGALEQDGGAEEFEIRLRRPATVVLRCVDATGGAIPGVLVLGRSSFRVAEHTIGLDWSSTSTDAAGRASLMLAPGEVGAKVECWRAGVRVLERELAALGASEARDLGDLVLAEAKVLRGVVMAADGTPAAGAFVVVERHDPRDRDHDVLASALIVPKRGGRVDARGRFEVRGMLPGLWDLLVYGGGHPRLLRVGIAVPARGEPGELELHLPVPVALEGRVVDAAGAPVPHASIAFLRSHPVAPNLLEETRADAQGRFSIPGFTREDSDVPLWVVAPGSGAPAVRVEATPRDGPVEVRLP